MDIQQNNVAVLHFNLVNQDGSKIFIRKTKLATFNLINPSEVSVPITDIGFDATLNQCWVRVPKESNATTGQYYGVLNIVDDDWGTYTTSKIKVYSVVSDADEDTKSVVFTATCIATQVTNPSGGNSPYYNTTTGTWWQYSDTLKAFEDTGVGNLIKYITKNVQHLKDGTGNGSIVTCLDDEISANNMATGLCSTDFGKNNENRGESCVALGEHNYIAEGVSNATAIAGAQPSVWDVFAIGDKTAGHKNVFEINQFGDIYFRPDSSQERIVILQDILNSIIKNVVYDSSKYSLTVTFYSAEDNVNKTKTYDLSGLKAVLKDDAVKKISVNQSTAVMTVDTINGSSQQIQLPIVQSDWNTTDTSADSYILNKPTALSSFSNDSGFDTVTSVNSKLGNYLPLTGNAATATTATKLDGYYTTIHYDNATVGGFYGNICVPIIDSVGVMEVGKYIDFHASSTLLNYSARITCNSATGNEISLPSSSGVLALKTDNVASATKLANARTITLTGDTTGTATFDGSANITITTSTNYAPSSIQPFDFLDSNEVGTFWTQTNTNSIAVPFMTDSKVVTHKVRIYINSTAGAKIRCAVYKNRIENEEFHLDLVGQTQICQENRVRFIDIPFETVATLDSDALYYFVFECSINNSTFVGKQINAGLTWSLVYKGDAFNANSDTFKSQYPTDGLVTGNVFIPYFKII